MIKNMKKSGFDVLHEEKYEKETKKYDIDFFDLKEVAVNYPKINFTVEKINFLRKEELEELEKEREDKKNI